MKRRKFIKKTTKAAISASVFPYILPSGIIGKKTTSMMADHVVFVLFAGGVRQQESVLQRYLAGSQNEDVEGNILYNMLAGPAPETKIAYGTDDNENDIIGRFPIDALLQNSLESQGTLFPEVQFSRGGTGHFGGLVTGVSGNYSSVDVGGLQSRPAAPTIFEYLRKHSGFKATDTWYVGLGTGGSRPLLNYSLHPDYGRKYAGNFIAPLVTFGNPGQNHFMNFKNYHETGNWDKVLEIRDFINQNFSQEGFEIPHLYNTTDEDNFIKSFVKSTFAKGDNVFLPPVNDNQDLKVIGYTLELLHWFKPKVTVVDLSNVDVCHGNFTAYLKNMHRADHGIGFLWKEIQNIPGMSGNTTMIVMPEHGRNLNPNSILDVNDWQAYDHSDANSRRIFTLMAGPGIDAGLRVGSEDEPVGDAADVVPTIADIFGIKQTVYDEGLIDSNARSLFDRL
ncbi:MAG: hypothetical protein ACI9P5_002008 [Saprospiraceae bacterium]|jgi:hypothetical protein|tara:strand:- start:526 stop:1875 length:1350 start_codon:yes stop_codon:yes gene_type:complete